MIIQSISMAFEKISQKWKLFLEKENEANSQKESEICENLSSEELSLATFINFQPNSPSFKYFE